MNPEPTIEAMRDTARVLNLGDARDSLRSLQRLQDAIDSVKAELLVELDATKSFEIDGASTLSTWVRNELRLNARQASILVKNAAVLRDLPLVAEAARAGKMSAAHVQVFAYGLKHIGLEPMREFEEAFVAVALDRDPGELFEVVKHLRDQLFPEDLDEAWKNGMDKQDFQVDAVPDGWHVTGFLNTVTGAKLKKVLDSVSAPRDKDDTRSGSERRVQGLDELLSKILGSGLPADKGVRPHMSVFADAQTVQDAADRARAAAENPFGVPPRPKRPANAGAPPKPPKPATLAGFGAIGPELLMYLFCMSDVTAFAMKDGKGLKQDQVLNVGTTRRSPSLKQRRAVIARQMGVCAAPGCKNTHLEVHHTIFWSHGGPTDLDLLIGLCTRCHHLLHRGGLNITGNAVDGFVFTKRDGSQVRRRRRTSRIRQPA